METGVTTFAWRPGWQYDVAATTMYWQAIVARIRNLVVLQQGMLHLCDSTIAGSAAWRDNALASKCESIPPFPLPPPLKPARYFAFRITVCCENITYHQIPNIKVGISCDRMGAEPLQRIFCPKKVCSSYLSVLINGISGGVFQSNSSEHNPGANKHRGN